MQFELFLRLAKNIKSDLTILFVALLFCLQPHIFTKDRYTKTSDKVLKNYHYICL